MKLKLFIVFTMLSGAAHAAVQGKTIEYRDGKTVLQGYIAYDDAIQGQRPAVIVVHDWLGVSAFTRERAETLAKMGYVALAADIYGKGVRPKDAAEAMAQVGIYKGNRPLLRARANAALKTLLAQPQTDPKRVAAIGYCFGGTTALELARSGASLAGIVSFHGGLDTPTPQDARQIKGKVLALTGADDPHVPANQVAAFENEMRDARVDWQLVAYGGAVHAFAVPTAGTDTTKGAAYNPSADRRSWQAMKDFFAEIFKS
jgi:dienelactone hydrolase